MNKARRLIEMIEDIVGINVVFDPAKGETHRIDEGRWIKTNTSNTMRIDNATHGVGSIHAHAYGRKGNEVGVVNLDGTASHGTRMKLSKKDAETLRTHGFNVRHDRIVEWIVRPDWTRNLLFG